MVTTNIIESPAQWAPIAPRFAGCHWQNGRVVPSWAASALLMPGQNFRWILGYWDL